VEEMFALVYNELHRAHFLAVAAQAIILALSLAFFYRAVSSRTNRENPCRTNTDTPIFS
jgi:hypothetical protein